MTLYTSGVDARSHWVRIAAAEKCLALRLVESDPLRPPEDLIDLNPYQTLPTLVDRELVVYEPQVIGEYLDERFPHPPLMPVDPVSRARTRLALYQIEHDWYDHARKLDAPGVKDAAQLRKVLRDNVVGSAELFKMKPFFLSDEFSMIDATIAPILWRLPRYEIDLPPQAQPILKYASTIFSRPAFRASLSESEREMRLA
jgi:stringent starvation protein A